MSYTFFCCGASIGVFFEYSDYIKFIKNEGHYNKIPFPAIRSIRYIIFAAAFAFINKYLEQWYFDEFVLTADFAKMSILNQYKWFLVYNICFRSFYYVAFQLQEGALLSSGFGYNGKDEKGNNRWDTVTSCNIVGVETTTSAIAVMQNWNHQVHVWLKYYVQHRLVQVGEHPTNMATFLTFMTSALWHGIYPMYFACFFYIFVLCEISKDFFKAGDKFAKVIPIK